jgi:hypothetical protein
MLRERRGYPASPGMTGDSPWVSARVFWYNLTVSCDATVFARLPWRNRQDPWYYYGVVGKTRAELLQPESAA